MRTLRCLQYTQACCARTCRRSGGISTADRFPSYFESMVILIKVNDTREIHGKSVVSAGFVMSCRVWSMLSHGRPRTFSFVTFGHSHKHTQAKVWPSKMNNSFFSDGIRLAPWKADSITALMGCFLAAEATVYLYSYSSDILPTGRDLTLNCLALSLSLVSTT